MKKIRHWLHIILALLTGGLWLLPYVVILATTEMYNRGYRAASQQCTPVVVGGNIGIRIIDGKSWVALENIKCEANASRQ